MNPNLTTAFAVSLLIGAAVLPHSASAQFPERDIPQECLNDNGRLMLTGANYAECAQYAYVEAPADRATDAAAPTAPVPAAADATDTDAGGTDTTAPADGAPAQ